MESLFQLLDARWFCLLQLFPRTPQAISIVFNYDFDAFHLTTLLTITIEHLLLYSIVSSHTAKIQTSREYCNKWIRLQISFLLVHSIPLTTEEKTSFHMNFGHQQDHQPITCSAECFPTYQETPYIKREKNRECKYYIEATNKKRKLPSQVLDRQGIHECVHELWCGFGREQSEQVREKAQGILLFSEACDLSYIPPCLSI